MPRIYLLLAALWLAGCSTSKEHPENMAGLTGGIFNFCANMASIIAPLIIGVIISATGNFFYALIYVGLTALIGVIAYIFIIGDIKRIELK